MKRAGCRAACLHRDSGNVVMHGSDLVVAGTGSVSGGMTKLVPRAYAK